MHGEIFWNFLSWKSINFSLLRSPSILYQAVSTKYVITFSPLYPLPGATKARDHLLKLQWNTEIIQEKDWIWRRFGSSILVNFDLLIKSTSTLWTLCYTSISLKTLMIHSNISPNVTTQPKPAIIILPANVDKTTLSAEYLDPHMPTVCALPRDSSWRPWQLVSPPAALTRAGCDCDWSVISFYKLLSVLLLAVNDITSWSV